MQPELGWPVDRRSAAVMLNSASGQRLTFSHLGRTGERTVDVADLWREAVLFGTCFGMVVMLFALAYVLLFQGLRGIWRARWVMLFAMLIACAFGTWGSLLRYWHLKAEHELPAEGSRSLRVPTNEQGGEL